MGFLPETKEKKDGVYQRQKIRESVLTRDKIVERWFLGETIEMREGFY